MGMEPVNRCWVVSPALTALVNFSTSPSSRILSSTCLPLMNVIANFLLILRVHVRNLGVLPEKLHAAFPAPDFLLHGPLDLPDHGEIVDVIERHSELAGVPRADDG